MDKAEQPTITQADIEAANSVLYCNDEASGFDAQGRFKLDMEKVALAFARHRTTSLAAQDGLDDHFPSGLRQRSHQIATAGDVVDGPVCVDCHCGASFSATDEGEARQLWASHAMAAMERPKTAAQDGLVEALRELEQAEVTYRYAHDVLGSGDIRTGRAWDKMHRAGDRARNALSAIKEQHHD